MSTLARSALLAACLLSAGCAGLGRDQRSRILLFLTDFGTKDGAVAACKGVMWSIAPRLWVTDLTHDIPPYNIAAAGEQLEQAVPYYPAGTIVVAVVDPGVGSARKPMAARTNAGHLLVGPDNGIFTLLLEREGLDVAVELRETRYWRKGETTSTFHGRDIFAAVGAHLAAGITIEALGPPLVPLRLALAEAKQDGEWTQGEVRYLEEPYGNVVTNIPMAMLGPRLSGDLAVELAGKSYRLPLRHTFSDVAVGESLALPHSRGLLSFSINQGDFAAEYAVKRGDPVRVKRQP